jgi:hypothetical protein
MEGNPLNSTLGMEFGKEHMILASRYNMIPRVVTFWHLAWRLKGHFTCVGMVLARHGLHERRVSQQDAYSSID